MNKVRPVHTTQKLRKYVKHLRYGTIKWAKNSIANIIPVLHRVPQKQHWICCQ
jgi:hypothetical protein